MRPTARLTAELALKTMLSASIERNEVEDDLLAKRIEAKMYLHDAAGKSATRRVRLLSLCVTRNRRNT